MCGVKAFCCGCSLRQGAITAAVLNVIEAISLLATAGRFFYVADKFQSSNQYGYEMSPENLDMAERVLMIHGGLCLAFGLIHLVTFICLVVGIAMGKAAFIMPWLISCMILIVLLFVFSLVLVLIKIYYLFFGLAYAAFYMYLWIIVIHYYSELRKGPHPYTQEIQL